MKNLIDLFLNRISSRRRSFDACKWPCQIISFEEHRFKKALETFANEEVTGNKLITKILESGTYNRQTKEQYDEAQQPSSLHGQVYPQADGSTEYYSLRQPADLAQLYMRWKVIKGGKRG